MGGEGGEKGRGGKERGGTISILRIVFLTLEAPLSELMALNLPGKPYLVLSGIR